MKWPHPFTYPIPEHFNPGLQKVDVPIFVPNTHIQGDPAKLNFPNVNIRPSMKVDLRVSDLEYALVNSVAEKAVKGKKSGFLQPDPLKLALDVAYSVGARFLANNIQMTNGLGMGETLLYLAALQAGGRQMTYADKRLAENAGAAVISAVVVEKGLKPQTGDRTLWST